MKGPAAIAPAFASVRGAGGFGLLVAALLVLPWALAAFGVPTREQLWRGIDSDSGAISYVWQQLFRETTDLDVVFLGASLMGAGIDTPQVQQALSRQLGREARVVTLAMNWRTEDRVHLILDELLRRRKVGLVIASMPKPLHARRWPGMSHELGHWMTPLDSDSALVRGMPRADRIGLAASLVLTGPRSLLHALREGRLGPAAEAASLGANRAELGFTRNGPGDPAGFRRVEIRPPRLAPEALIHDGDSQVLEFSETGASAYQRHCIEQTLRLLAEHDVPLVVLHLPGWPERANPRIEELEDWSALAGRPVPVLGVPPRELFAPVPDEEVQAFYYNQYHLNANGSEYFTAALLPGILEVATRHGI